MRRLSLLFVLACGVSLLTGCQPSGTGRTAQADASANAVTGDPIEVTVLDELPAEPEATETAAGAEGMKTAAPQVSPGAQTGPNADTGPAADPAATVEAAPPAPKPDLEAIPLTPKSERQLACEKKKGRWAKIGKGDARACVYQSKDSGKRCTKESQCDSVCLARSGTCAPFKPMYGCNEILQDNGARVTLCLD